MDSVPQPDEFKIDASKFDELARATNHLLRDSIAVHDDLFARSFWKALKPIDFPAHHTHLKAISKSLDAVLGFVSRSTWSADLNSKVSALQEFGNAFSETLGCLCGITLRLASKAEGGRYSAAEYRADVSGYEILRARQMDAGTRLNSAYRS